MYIFFISSVKMRISNYLVIECALLFQIIGFTKDMVASYIAVVGILSIIAQTALLSFLYQVLGNRSVILIGLTFEVCQLLFYSFGKEHWYVNQNMFVNSRYVQLCVVAL